MAPCPPELLDLAHYLASEAARRQRIAHELAETLGPGWAALDALRGDKGLPALRHVGSGVEFVAVPGGPFVMGLRDDDLDELGRYLDWRTVHATIQEHLRNGCRPTREVHVAPFLCTAQLVDDEAAERLGGKEDHMFEIDRTDASRFASQVGFRLPSEAELEYVAREGGALHFTYDIAAKRAEQIAQTSRESSVDTCSLVNGFGLEGLLMGEWAADDWHDSYLGAPTTSEAWVEGHVGGVVRGSLSNGLDVEDDLPYGLAAYRIRARVHEPSKRSRFEGTMARLALSIRDGSKAER